MSATTAKITSVEFLNFKAFRHFSVSFEHVNILVGPNNSGKSTVVSAFRALDAALRHARSRLPQRLADVDGAPFGYALVDRPLPISTENVATEYEDVDARISYRLSNGNKLHLVFPCRGAIYLLPDCPKGPPHSTAAFKAAFPISLLCVPHLGPLEHEERLVEEETVRSNLGTHRASRHFRNYWRFYPDGFERFAELIKATWPGMEIERPELVHGFPRTLAMYCKENRATRELFWSGVGFQIWCQLLTHLSRTGDSTLVVLDEPEIYLHPEVQHQLLSLIRAGDADVVLATHSTEIMGEADPEEILLIDKAKRSARRVKDVEGVQQAMDMVGSVQNVTLAQLAKNRRILFTEGTDDFRVLRRFAAILKHDQLAAGAQLTPVESDGFSSWERIRDFAWGLQKTVGEGLKIAAVFDHDYYCDEQVASLLEELHRHIDFACVLGRKEMENYLLIPAVLQRALDRALVDRQQRTGVRNNAALAVEPLLHEITAPLKAAVQSQYLARRWDWFRPPRTKRDNADVSMETIQWFDERWNSLDQRLKIVPGKDVLKALRDIIKQRADVALTDAKILQAFRADDVPSDMVELVRNLEEFRES